MDVPGESRIFRPRIHLPGSQSVEAWPLPENIGRSGVMSRSVLADLIPFSSDLAPERHAAFDWDIVRLHEQSATLRVQLGATLGIVRSRTGENDTTARCSVLESNAVAQAPPFAAERINAHLHQHFDCIGFAPVLNDILILHAIDIDARQRGSPTSSSATCRASCIRQACVPQDA